MASGINREVRMKGLALSKGCIIGKVCMFNENRHSNLPIYRVEGKGIEREISRVDRAIELAAGILDKIRLKVASEIGKSESEIFVAQKMILADEVVHAGIKNYISHQNANAETAVARILDGYEARLAALDDEYIRARATDIGEVKRRLLDVLGNMNPSMQCDKKHCVEESPRVIVAAELTPSLTVDVDRDRTLAFVTERGGVNSHAAILARALGIPAVSGLKDIRDLIGCGAEIIVDGNTGEVILWPEDDTIRKKGVDTGIIMPPEPINPVPGFKVMANMNLASDMRESLRMKAEGIGLYRTEFEVMAAERFFSEDELYERYRAVVDAMAGQVVVFRLFDMGSDKSMPFMELPDEDNPSLGWRGARLLLGRRDILETQARALARVSAGGLVHVMYPMIVDANQFLEIKKVFAEAVAGIPCGDIQHGIMFEVPSACLQARELYKHIDFASIGTNDLTQYLFAVDRDNDKVSYDYNPDRPVFWNLIADIACAAREAGKPLSVCGEIAGYPEYIPQLVAAGINAVSVSPRRIPDVRKSMIKK